MTETRELTVLTTDECQELLRSESFGRLGVIVDHEPLIIPVNYALDRGVVVLRKKPGSTLLNAQHTNVSFEVDRIDATTRTGWSVLVRGLAEEVTPDHDAGIVGRTRATGLEPWAPGEDFRWVRIIPHGISGRRITAEEAPFDWHLGTAAYM